MGYMVDLNCQLLSNLAYVVIIDGKVVKNRYGRTDSQIQEDIANFNNVVIQEGGCVEAYVRDDNARMFLGTIENYCPNKSTILHVKFGA